MIPNNNPFRKLGKFESFVAAFMAEDDKKPLMTWFDKFEKALKKLGTDYKKSSINPTDALEYYYDKKSPDEAAKALAESVQLDEYIKKDGARKRCSGGDGRRTDVEMTELSRDEPEVVFDFKSERDAKQFAKDVENSAVGLANKGVERYKGKYRVVITGMTKDTHKKAIGKYAHKNKGEFSHSSSEVTPKGYGPYDESVEELDEKFGGKTNIPASKEIQKHIESGKALIHNNVLSSLHKNARFVVIKNPYKDRSEKGLLQDGFLMATISDPKKGRIKLFAYHGSHVSIQKAMDFAKLHKLVARTDKYGRPLYAKESVYDSPHTKNLGTGAKMVISKDEQKLLDFINKNW